MTLEQLHYFFEVYQYRSINSASARLNISQQSLSSAIRNLENEFSTKFFERNYRGVHPTPAGDRFFQTVQNILKEIHDFNMYLTPQENITKCDIGFFHALSDSSSELYAILTQKYPNVFFNFQSFPYSNFNSLPLSQYPDFSFCYITASFLKETFILPPDYSFSYVCEEPYYVRLWMSKYHPYANFKQLSYEQVKSLDFVYLSTIFHSKDIIEAHFGKEIISDNTYQAQNWPILLSMIRNHQYVTTDIVRNNIPIINPKLAEEKDLLQKELPKSLSEVFFVLIYKNSHQKFYPDIIQYLRDKFCF